MNTTNNITKKEESEEEQEDVEWQQLQSIVYEVWHKKWKQTLKNAVNNARTTGNGEVAEDNIPPLITSPQEDINSFAERSVLWRDKGKLIDRRREPTKKSASPMPILGILLTTWPWGPWHHHNWVEVPSTRNHTA